MHEGKRPLDNSMQSIFDALERDARAIPDGMAEIDGPVAVFNSTGTKPPLVWCFNNWAEPAILARRLDPEQPLIALRSLHKVEAARNNKRANIVDLAIAYMGHIAHRLPGDGPLLVGGNCQAVPIAETMAHRLLAATGRTPLLITLERAPIYSYPGDVLLLYGDTSELNPFLGGNDPTPTWRVMYRTPAWGLVEASHGKFFTAPGLLELSAHIQHAMTVFSKDGKLQAGEMPLRKGGYTT